VLEKIAVLQAQNASLQQQLDEVRGTAPMEHDATGSKHKRPLSRTGTPVKSPARGQVVLGSPSAHVAIAKRPLLSAGSISNVEP